MLVGAAMACLAPEAAHAIIFSSTGDPTHNTSAPSDPLQAAALNLQGLWNGYTGTPIAPQYFLAAKHTGGLVGGTMVMGGRTYTTTGATDIGTTDLRVWKIAETFPGYVQMYGGNAEPTNTFFFTGRGTQRGDPIVVNSETKGWKWGTLDQVRRWGQNSVGAITSLVNVNDSLSYTFDRTGVSDEGFISLGDSGGGAFMLSGGVYKLIGMNWAINKEPWSYSMTNDPNTTADDPFNAALVDMGGLYDWSGNPSPSQGALVQDIPNVDQPLTGYLSRVSPYTLSISNAMTGPPVWNVDSNGNWGTAGNWWKSTIPSGTTAEAVFGSVTTAARTVTMDSARTVGTLTFDSNSSYTIAGSNTLTLQGSTGSSLIRVYLGSHTISAPLTLANNTQVTITPANSTLTVSGTLTSNGINITKDGAGTLVVNRFRNSGLTVSSGTVRVATNGGNAGVSMLTSLSIASGAALDLNDNDLVVNGSSNFTTVRGWVFSGFSTFPDSTKTGIVSSTSQSNGGKTILAMFDNSLVGVGDWPPGSGQTVSSNSVIGKYTYFGDLNLDGQVTGDDYPTIDSNLNTTPVAGLAWLRGDANLDGIVTGDDYAVIDSNLGNGTSNPLTAQAMSAAVGAVPEPASLGILGIAAGLWTARRRRRNCF